MAVVKYEQAREQAKQVSGDTRDFIDPAPPPAEAPLPTDKEEGMRCPCDYKALPNAGLIMSIASLVKLLDGELWATIPLFTGWVMLCVGEHLEYKSREHLK